MTAALLLLLAAGGCSSKGEQAAAEEEAAQIEHARMAGREAARVFVNTIWRDTIEIQHRLLEAAEKRSKFDGKPKSTEAFDSAFISTVRTVRPDVATQLEQARKSQK